MANISSIGGNPIVPATVQPNSVTDAMLAQTGGVLEKVDGIFSEVPIATSIREIAGATAYMGYNGTTSSTYGAVGVAVSTNTPGYDSYMFFPSKEMDIWFGDVSASYLALTWGTAYTETITVQNGYIAKCTSPTRYRKSDGNLPTEQNKLHVPAGSVVCFTLPQGKNQDVYGFATETVVKESFADDVLAYSQQDKGCAIKYLTQSGVTPEVLQVFVPASVGYVRYDFVRSVDASINCDVWRINNAYAVTDALAERFALTTGGEWECALHLHGRSDFSGGAAHGDEVTDEITFLVDGAIADVTTFTEVTKCRSIVAVQVSTLYDPADSTTEIAKHGSAHVFTDAGLDVEQTVTWLVAEQLDACYMAMLPAAKAVTNRFFTDKEYAVKVADGTRMTAVGAKSATLFSTTAGVQMDFSIDQYPDVTGGSDAAKKFFLLTDNTSDHSGLYNKCYFVINTDASGNVTCSVGEEWKSTTTYRIEVGE